MASAAITIAVLTSPIASPATAIASPATATASLTSPIASPATAITSPATATASLTSPIASPATATAPLALPISPVAYHKFLDHSPEIQLAIWRFCLPPPRIIQVHLASDRDVFFSSTAPPVALQICHDSRREALKVYSPCFQSLSPPWSTHFSKRSRPIYVDPSRDIIYVVGSPPVRKTLFLASGINDDMARMQLIAIGLSALIPGPKLFHDVRNFNMLKTLYVVVKEPNTKPIDFRTGAHQEFDELDKVSGDKLRVYLSKTWCFGRNVVDPPRRTEHDPSLRFVAVQLMIDTPTYK
ncbi:hypothetical protein ACEPPN_000376 [Leptodophora sp. 'Broadleaf-Isolate-01']